MLFFDGSLLPGYLLMGWLPSSFGTSIAVLIGALFCLAVMEGGWLWHKSVEKAATGTWRGEDEHCYNQVRQWEGSKLDSICANSEMLYYC